MRVQSSQVLIYMHIPVLQNDILLALLVVDRMVPPLHVPTIHNPILSITWMGMVAIVHIVDLSMNVTDIFQSPVLTLPDALRMRRGVEVSKHLIILYLWNGSACGNRCIHRNPYPPRPL